MRGAFGPKRWSARSTLRNGAPSPGPKSATRRPARSDCSAAEPLDAARRQSEEALPGRDKGRVGHRTRRGGARQGKQANRHTRGHPSTSGAGHRERRFCREGAEVLLLSRHTMKRTGASRRRRRRSGGGKRATGGARGRGVRERRDRARRGKETDACVLRRISERRATLQQARGAKRKPAGNHYDAWQVLSVWPQASRGGCQDCYAVAGPTPTTQCRPSLRRRCK